ncbi:MAG TPA: PHP domain-containing protein [Candidatus Saccharimonadia bacterium]|nr:PHP domain-containing protein [Candidatus Saccharimonadia bacterium]
MIRADLHTHSQASPDGSLTLNDYRKMLSLSRLEYIAVTDHDRIDFALQAQATLGDRIIVGEEVTTTDGEIIGLYLHKAIPAGLSAAETIKHIRQQGGLVYIPHPFETVRKGITLDTLNEIADAVDIIEAYNGRSLQNRAKQAAQWAKRHQKATASSSDAHGRIGWGRTYTTLATTPQSESLVEILMTSTIDTRSTGFIGRLYPKLNRLRGKR